jgi:hypothetical protein
MPKIEQLAIGDRHSKSRPIVAWDAWFCRNRRCPETVWLAQRRPGQPQTWVIARNECARPWEMDGASPDCPNCGQALSPALGLMSAEID